jgi:hypothetical protein
MTDDPFYAPNRPPTPPRTPTTARHDGSLPFQCGQLPNVRFGAWVTILGRLVIRLNFSQSLIKTAIFTCLCVVAIPSLSEAERGFVGGGIGSARGDLVNRDTSASRRITPHPFLVWFLETEVGRAGRIAFGAEFVNLGEVRGRLESACCTERNSQKEDALLGVLRVRSGGIGPLAVDVIGDLGVLFQKSVSTGGSRFPPTETTTTENARSSAFGIGVDLPVQINTRIAVVPLMRLYFLQRERMTDPLDRVAQQPSRRPALGVTGRLTW